jgi:hypothetical protein
MNPRCSSFGKRANKTLIDRQPVARIIANLQEDIKKQKQDLVFSRFNETGGGGLG